MALVRRLVLLLVFVGVLVLGWMLADANSAPISVDYLLGRVEGVPTWLVVLVSFAVGVLAMALMAAGRLLRGQLVQRRYRKAVEGLESEVHQLRNLPLGDDELTPPARAVGRARRAQAEDTAVLAERGP